MSKLSDHIMKKVRETLGLPGIPQYKIRRFLKKAQKKQTEYIPGKLTLVVPCYKHEKYLLKCIESILAQTVLPDEVIFINDHSPDKTLEILEAVQNRYNKMLRISIIDNKHNLCQAASINLAAEKSDSEFIMILNDDDYLMPWAIEITKQLFSLHKELALIGSTATAFKDNGELKNLGPVVQAKDVDLKIHTPVEVKGYKNINDLNMSHSGSTFTRNAWMSAGKYFPLQRKRLVPFDDRDFQLRVALLFPVGVSLEIPFVFWRSNSSVISFF